MSKNWRIEPILYEYKPSDWSSWENISGRYENENSDNYATGRYTYNDSKSEDDKIGIEITKVTPRKSFYNLFFEHNNNIML